MRRLLLAAILPVGFILSVSVLSSSSDSTSIEIQRDVSLDQARLRHTLRSVAQYCEKVKRVALFYVCVEKVKDTQYFFRGVTQASGLMREERIFEIGRVARRTYTYDYQLIKKGDDIQEDRTLLEENGEKRNKKHAPLTQTKYSARLTIYGPVGFLSSYWQQHFVYSVVGEERIGDVQALVIRAVPNEDREDNDQVGRIWIGPDFQVLRVEIEPASLEDYEDEVITSSLGDFHKKLTWTIDYSVEKNGVRFPGRQTIREEFIRTTANGFEQKALKRETIFDYLDYKFFIVKTDVDFKRK